MTRLLEHSEMSCNIDIPPFPFRLFYGSVRFHLQKVGSICSESTDRPTQTEIVKV